MTAAPDPVLLDVVRGSRVESQHRGRMVLLGPGGEPAVELGDLTEAVYARSSLKPLQAAAMLRAGWPAADAAMVALASASHEGEAVHRDGARRILTAAALDESALQCPPDLPHRQEALLEYVAAGGRPASICHNCSGKHAAMVATCAANGWDVASYLDPAHPLQRAVVAEIETACGASIAATTVDGCGAPAHAVPLPALAAGFAALATAGSGPGHRVASAVGEHPFLLGGTGRAVSELVAEVPGLLAKDGAEGVWAAALPDGRAFAAKVDDGAARALPALLAAVLTYWGFDGPAVRQWSAVPVLGGGRRVGEIRWAPALRAALALA